MNARRKVFKVIMLYVKRMMYDIEDEIEDEVEVVAISRQWILFI